MTIWVINVLTGGRGCEGGQVWGHARRRGCGTARTRPAGAADIVGDLIRVIKESHPPRKPVKQHICCFYWLTRGGEVAAVGLAGADFGYTKSFRAAGVRFYLHKLFRAAGRRILSTQSFRAAGVLWLRFLSLCFVR